MHHEDFLGNPVVKTVLPLQGMWVRSLVGELRSYMLCSTAKRSFLKCTMVLDSYKF